MPIILTEASIIKNYLQCLILADEEKKTYTNFGDGRPGDASELVAKVNADPALNQGYSDWRLPTIDELKSLIESEDAPKKAGTGRLRPMLTMPFTPGTSISVVAS